MNCNLDKASAAREARIAVGLVLIASAVESWHPRPGDPSCAAARAVERLNHVEALLGVEAVQLAVREFQA